MRIFVTKYCLTQGIIEVDAETTHTPGMMYKRGDGWWKNVYYHRSEWAATREEAVQKAKAKRDKTVKAMRVKLHKLENMDF